MSPRALLLLALATACQGLRLLDQAENWAENASADELFGTGDPDQEDLVDLGSVTEEEEADLRMDDSRRVELSNTPFKNVLLVVHCRLHGVHLGNTDGNATALCKTRFQLFRPMYQYFPEIVFWTNEDCVGGPINPHSCLARLVDERGEGRDGLLYMHFDAIIKPQAMAESFDPKAIGVFDGHTLCSVTDGCNWGVWRDGPASGQLKQAYKKIKSGHLLGTKIDAKHFWLGTDDIFYLPKSIFRTYSDLVPLMGQTHHEIAGPTMWRLISNAKKVHVVELGCMGSCCSEVKGYEALEKGFRCGHPFKLDVKENRDAFARAMHMH